MAVSVKNTLLWIRRQVGKSAFKGPNRGLESSFCCQVAGQGLAQTECFFSQTPVALCPRDTLPSTVAGSCLLAGLVYLLATLTYVKIHQRGGAVETGCSDSSDVIH